MEEATRQNWKNYLFQPLWGAAIIMLLLFSADFILSETLIASFGSTIFIASTMPLSKFAKPRYFIGGYACGIVAGICGFIMCAWLPAIPVAIVVGLAISMAIFLMVALRFEHPPAGGLAMGLALSPNPDTAALLAFGGILMVCFTLRFTKQWMKNLL